LQNVYRYWAWIVVVAIILQIGFAGYGAFYAAEAVDDAPINDDKFEDGFGIHLGFGYLIVLLILVFLLIAFAARVGPPRIWQNLSLFGLVIIQVLLAWFGEAVPWIGFFHPINAFLILALTAWLAYTAPRGPAARATEPAAT
jgi:hypothetical protein